MHGESERFPGSRRVDKKAKVASNNRLMMVGQPASGQLAVAQGSRAEVGSNSEGDFGVDTGHADAASSVMGASNGTKCRSAGSPAAVILPSAASSQPAVSHGLSSMAREVRHRGHTVVGAIPRKSKLS